MFTWKGLLQEQVSRESSSSPQRAVAEAETRPLPSTIRCCTASCPAADANSTDISASRQSTAADGSSMLSQVSQAVQAAAAQDPLLAGAPLLNQLDADDAVAARLAPNTPDTGTPTAAEGSEQARERSDASSSGGSPVDEFSERFRAEATKLTDAQTLQPAKVGAAREASLHENLAHTS